MHFKELVWFLCAISLSTSIKIHSDYDADSYAYSTVYRSFDKSNYEGAQTVSSPAEGVDKPRPDGGPLAMSTTTAASTSNNNQQSNTVNKNWTTVCQFCQSVDTPAATTSAPKTSPANVSTTTAPVTAPVKNMTQTSSPLTMPVTQPGRHVTPGLSAYAYSKEEHDHDHDEGTYGSYESEESHETFEGFSSW